MKIHFPSGERLSTESVLFNYLRLLPLIELRSWLSKAGSSFEDLPSAIRAWRDLGPGHESLDTRRALEWTRANRDRLTSALFRVVDPPDQAVAELLSERDCPSDWRELTLSFHFRDAGPESFRINELAVASALFSEVYLAVGSAHYPLNIVIEPPVVRLQSGSIQFTTSGTLLPVGVAIILASAAGLVAAPLGYAAGAVLASAGTVDTFLGWRRTIAERNKLRAEEAKLRAEGRKFDAERAKIAADSRRERMAEALIEDEFMTVHDLDSAASANVERQVIQHLAQRYNVSEAYVSHLLNRTLPTLEAIQRLSPRISHELRDPNDDTLPLRQ